MHAKFKPEHQTPDRNLPGTGASRSSRVAEEKLGLVEEACSIGHWSLDLLTGHERWSAGLFRITGIDPRAVAPTQGVLEMLVHPADKEQYRGISRHMKSRGAQALQFRIVRPDGFCRWVKARIEPVLGIDGSPTHLLGILNDVTELEHWKAAALVDSVVLQLMNETIGLVVWQAELDGSGPPAWEAFFGDSVDCCNPFADLEDQAATSLATAWAEARHLRQSVNMTCQQRNGGEIFIRGLPVSCERSSERWVFVTLDLTTARRTLRSQENALQSGMLRPSQLRAARAVLNWSGQELASRAGLSFSTVRRMEDERAPHPKTESAERLTEVLKAAGIGFESSANGILSVSFSPGSNQLAES